MKTKTNVPFPAPYCIFLRTYLLKMFCGKRKKRHFPDLQFKNILGNMRPDSLFWSAFRALTFLLCAHLQNLLLCPLMPRNRFSEDDPKVPKIVYNSLLIWLFKVTDSVALKKRVKIEHLGYFVWNIEPQVSRFKTRFIQLPVDTGAPNDCFL